MNIRLNISKLLLQIIALFFAFPFLNGQDLEKIQFRKLSVAEGLNNNIVYRMIQDENDAVWFATHDGIDRYDGYNFHHYDLNLNNESETGNRQINSFIKISNNEFWIGSGPNLYRYDASTDDFTLLIRNLRREGTAGNSAVNIISNIAFSRDSLCYLGTNLGVFTFDIKSREIKFLSDLSVSILSFYQQEDLLWIGTRDGLKFYNTKNKELIDIFNNEDTHLLQEIDAFSYLEQADNNSILIGTRSRGLYLIDTREKSISHLIPDREDNTAIRVIRKYGDYFLVGSDGSGLRILDQDYRVVAQYTHNEDDHFSLGSNGIYDILIDKQKRIWIGTYGGGVSIFDPNIKAFRIIKHEQNNSNSLTNNASRSILEVGNDLWFGTANGISILQENGTWKHLVNNQGGQKANVILSLCEDSQGQIWAGTFSRGIYIFDRSGRLIHTLTSKRSSSIQLTTNFVYALHEDKYSNMWIGGIRGELMRYNTRTSESQIINGIQSVNCIEESAEGNLWIGTMEGVVKINIYEDQLCSPDNSSDSLLTDLNLRVYSILETKTGELWIGTEGAGLLLYDRRNNSITKFTDANGLPSNFIYGILADKNGNLWLSTTNGLSKYTISSNSFTNYTVADGLTGKDFNYGAYYKLQSGELVFGGSRGITIFNPDEISNNEIIPEVVFTDITVYGKNNTIVEEPFAGRNINHIEKLILNHDQNSVTIDFAAINYTSTEKNQYRWLLKNKESNEENWVPLSFERRAIYSYLPPGHYIFWVQASNNDGYWNRDGKKLEIIIKPPFWNTILAKVIYGILGIMLFVALQRYIITFINEKQAKEKIQFFINIAHDIRSPLTLIKSPINKLLESEHLSSEEKQEIEIAAKNSDRLNNLVNQLLDFQKATLNKSPLLVGKYDIVSIVNDILNNFQPLLDKKLLNTKIDSKADELWVWMDRLKIEKILYNLISNAIKYSFEGGKLLIKIEAINNTLSISVNDTGRGIPSKQQKEIFNRYFRADNAINSKESGSGVGLMLSKKLIEIHKGSINFSSEENKGSEFRINFPADKDSYKESEIIKEQTEELLTKSIITDTHTHEFDKSYTILIAEDNSELRSYLGNELQKNYNVLLAKNGKDAYEQTIKMDVDLIISDVMMPEMDGRELCLSVRGNISTSHIPIILLTALNSVDYKIEGLEYGADAYIEKPFDILHLQARIKNLLRSRETLQKRLVEIPDIRSDIDIQNKPDQQLLMDIHEIVSDKISKEDFSVEELCRIIGMSRPVLYRKLKTYTGLSPQEYISNIRLKRAAQMIAAGKKTMKEIAYEIGFSDPKYFSKSFKKHFGISPSEYLTKQGDTSSEL